MARILDQVIGHQEVLGRLLQAIQSGRLSHATLLVGPSGIGKRKVAMGLAQAIVCETSPRACGTCASCIRLEKGSSESLLLVEPEGNAIKIEKTKEVIKFFSLRQMGKSRVVIINEAEKMNSQAANALLKSLEEPPENSFFLMTTSNPSGLLQTIRSRVQVSRFSSLNESEVRQLVKAPDWAVKASHGRVDMVENLVSEESQQRRKQALMLLQYLVDRKQTAYWDLTQELAQDKEQMLFVAQLATQMVRDARVLAGGANHLIHEDFRSALQDLSQIGPQRLDQLAQLFFEMEKDVFRNISRPLVFENMFVRALL